MKRMLAPALAAHQGIIRVSVWFGFSALVSLGMLIMHEGLAGRAFLLSVAALKLFAAFGLLRAEKSAWHIAAFLAFMGMVWNAIAAACAPGALARGDMHLFEVVWKVFVLVISFVVFSYLRRPDIRSEYGVSESYRST